MLSRMIRSFSGSSIKALAIKGSFWQGLGGGTEHTLRLLRNMILVRILAPEAFGLMAIVLSVNFGFEQLTQLGVRQAVVQNPNGREATFLNGAWWLSFARSAFFFVIAYSSAPWIAEFYDNVQLTSLLRLASLSILLNGVSSVKSYVVLKDMDFKRWATIKYGGSICGILVAIFLGITLENIWALVIGFTCEATARCLFSYIVCPYLPRLRFEPEHWRTLLRYAKGMLGIPILTFLFIRADVFFVGKICSKDDLGLYAMAVTLAQTPFLLNAMLIDPIMLPIFSRFQHNFNKINTLLIGSTSFVGFLFSPLLFYVVFYSSEILTLFYGKTYASVGIPFAIRFGQVLVRTCSAPIVSIFLALGRPELHRFFTTIRTILILLLLYPFIRAFGLVGAASAGLAAMLVAYFFQLRRISSTTGLSIRKYLLNLAIPLLFSFPVPIVWFVTSSLIVSNTTIWLLTGGLAVISSFLLVIISFFCSKAFSSMICFSIFSDTRQEEQ
jgi:lipopolysaccharide exporter